VSCVPAIESSQSASLEQVGVQTTLEQLASHWPGLLQVSIVVVSESSQSPLIKQAGVQLE
jgi:hypothetical protein